MLGGFQVLELLESPVFLYVSPQSWRWWAVSVLTGVGLFLSVFTQWVVLLGGSASFYSLALVKMPLSRALVSAQHL